jgi:hypothetical protein
MNGLNLERKGFDTVLFEDIPGQLLQSVVSVLVRTGTVIDSFHCRGTFSVFQVQIMNLWIAVTNVSPPA